MNRRLPARVAFDLIASARKLLCRHLRADSRRSGRCGLIETGSDVEGGMAVEFAFIAPIMVALVSFTLQAGLALWQWNVLQSVAESAARCVATGAVPCGTVSSGCGSSDAGICYVQTLAKSRGVSGLTAAGISLNRSVTHGSLTFTFVSITYGVSVLATKWNLSATASFPNS